jgi:hypothetical protein
MRVKYPKNDRSCPIIQCGRAERMISVESGADGRAVAEVRARVAKRARDLFAAGAVRVEVFAAAEFGGHKIAEYEAADDAP